MDVTAANVKTWALAEDFCRNIHHGALATIRSQEQNDHVTNLLDGAAWIGGKLIDGAWRWAEDGGAFPPAGGSNLQYPYSNWMEGQPAARSCSTPLARAASSEGFAPAKLGSRVQYLLSMRRST